MSLLFLLLGIPPTMYMTPIIYPSPTMPARKRTSLSKITKIQQCIKSQPGVARQWSTRHLKALIVHFTFLIIT